MSFLGAWHNTVAAYVIRLFVLTCYLGKFLLQAMRHLTLTTLRRKLIKVGVIGRAPFSADGPPDGWSVVSRRLIRSIRKWSVGWDCVKRHPDTGKNERIRTKTTETKRRQLHRIGSSSEKKPTQFSFYKRKPNDGTERRLAIMCSRKKYQIINTSVIFYQLATVEASEAWAVKGESLTSTSKEGVARTI